MMSKILVSTGAELLSGPSENSFTPNGGYPQDMDIPVAEEHLHFAIVETCQAIVYRKVTAMAYVTALLAHARRYPGLAQFVTQFEASAMTAARKIDEALNAGRLLPPPSRNNMRAKRIAARDHSTEFPFTESPPPVCKL